MKPTDSIVPAEAGRREPPSLDAWLREAKNDPAAENCGMYLCHNGVVRRSAKAAVRYGQDAPPVAAVQFSSDREKVRRAVEAARAMPGIYYVRVWLNSGRLAVGEDLMFVLVGGDIRDHVADALLSLVKELKTTCVVEAEIPE